MKICLNCKKENRDKEEKCKYCGGELVKPEDMPLTQEETNRKMLKLLTDIEDSVFSIKRWVTLFGVVWILVNIISLFLS